MEELNLQIDFYKNKFQNKNNSENQGEKKN